MKLLYHNHNFEFVRLENGTFGFDDIYRQVPADLLMVAKYFERIGDHATNIAEWVIYSITGKHVDEADN